MISAILIIHVIVCFFLIVIVLMQTGKGADIGAAFGGTSTQTLFGSTGGNTFFNKLTIGVATVFMLTCLLLAYFSSKPGTRSIMKTKAAQTAPMQQVQKKKTSAGPGNTGASQQSQKVDTGEKATTTSAPTANSQPTATTSESSKTSKQSSAPLAGHKGADQKNK